MVKTRGRCGERLRVLVICMMLCLLFWRSEGSKPISDPPPFSPPLQQRRECLLQGGGGAGGWDAGKIKGKADALLRKMESFDRPIVCAGPMCLKVGSGWMLGAGCGVGVGVGGGLALTGAGGGFDSVAGSRLGQLMLAVPGGHVGIDILRKILRRFPTSRVGAGIGVGFGYSIYGVGLQWSGAMPLASSGLSAAAGAAGDGDSRERDAVVAGLLERIDGLEERLGVLEGMLAGVAPRDPVRPLASL